VFRQTTILATSKPFHHHIVSCILTIADHHIDSHRESSERTTSEMY